ncbi:PREDICTED: mRNAion factor [Prunus dulcis]|uniref:PREDICTED: mRNAion factor n=1 Tax=Prunus dulcis TaxID=3755 RepID=A0A5E4FPU6_PRUDU|nr:transcription factor GTE12-like isoform X1 [Prunus dulcis]XP_034211965.1 transcription factor GTE12-like isoform X1 [Prunus dulcis]VVA29410.1 PREDICTED: mRNAion factor [Prunus dulcis]VVA32158.1 PREDICTED: mRNAion factor [Prunus dulcis]
MIATKTMLSSNKLKIKFACKRIEADLGKKIEADPQKRSCDFGHQVSLNEVSSMAKPSFPGSKKRAAPEALESQKEKKLKMDRSVTLQCSTILKTLITHKDGWAFSKPVDPLSLNIPDYFHIISHPMDLGTIKSKLEKNMYRNTEEFAADVRLTFSNAMVYNPPANIFHQMAKNLNKIFEMRWCLLGGKLNHGSSKVEPGKSLSGQIKKVTYTRQNPDRTPPFHNMSVTKRSMPSEEKVRVHVDTRQNLSRTPPFHNMSVTKRSMPSEEKVRVHFGVSDGEAELSKTVQHCTPKLLAKNSNRGTDSGSRQASGAMNANQPSSPVGRKCGSCGNLACRCGLPCDSMGRDHGLSNPNASRLDCQAKSLSTSQMSKSDPESDGAVSALDDENICPSPQLTTPVTDAASGEEWKTSLFDVQLSPKRALRAAMLKSRFADTIWKAQQEKLLDQGGRCDPMKMRQEKARLERRQHEEKARIEAEIRAAEAATRMRAEIELKQQRKRKREEARIALEKMQRTVEIDQNLRILEELERLTGFSPSTPLLNCKGRSGAFRGAHLRSPLEQLGLFIKAEYSGDEDDDESILNEDGEEGEIV